MKLPKVPQHVTQQARVQSRVAPSVMVVPRSGCPRVQSICLRSAPLWIKSVQIFQLAVFLGSLRHPDCPWTMLPLANPP